MKVGIVNEPYPTRENGPTGLRKILEKTEKLTGPVENLLARLQKYNIRNYLNFNVRSYETIFENSRAQNKLN